ncbi:DUF72 domain-containing protein [Thermofilum pendens]|uniref:DUF72 domain-containing protein n=1 Tax=Thermofilum pendens (strain DSM 2475 / Hrk 5) TaxID=368408 RepID=A1RWG1_THEPD|nr:DUF72 domain-containing protein [Thermofilum pendens]ABL77541.1 protein of unknown function DUF72 [Thermofilum pendens Hrk 5]
MELYVGSSGWVYDWNPDGLAWYASQSGFNAVELNMSFYSFPKRTTVEKWAEESEGLRWSIKVHRSITHVRRLNEKSHATWSKFRELFEPIEDRIDFYLFQLPPSMAFTPEAASRVAAYASLAEKIAVEPRHKSWFRKEVYEFFEEKGVFFVTPDSPLFEGLPPDGVVCIRGVVYVRMHGRLAWYNYGYLDEELREVAEKIISANPQRAYVFFNNDHDMLGDGLRLKEILLERGVSFPKPF